MGHCSLCRRSSGQLSRGFETNNGTDFLCIVCWELEKLTTSIRSKMRSMGPVARQMAAGMVLSARIELNVELHKLQKQEEEEADDDYMQHEPNSEDDWGYY